MEIKTLEQSTMQTLDLHFIAVSFLSKREQICMKLRVYSHLSTKAILNGNGHYYVNFKQI